MNFSLSHGGKIFKDNNLDSLDAKNLIYLPDYMESGMRMNMGDTESAYYVIYTGNDTTGNLTELEFWYDEKNADQKQVHNFGFICGAIASVFTPTSDFNLLVELSNTRKDSMWDISSAFDGDVKYEYVIYI